MFFRGTFLSLFISLSLPLSLEAKLLRILHTNDLHAQLKGVQDQMHLGGYAQLKKVMDQLKIDSEKEGIPVITLDAGDFSEGGFAYKAGNGLSVFQVMKEMGYDAIALGNHDYLMGAKRLTEILSETKLPLVAANIHINKKETVLRENILPYRIVDKGELKIGVVGATTNDIFYRWVLKNKVDFEPATKMVNKTAKHIRHMADITIALTHIGLEADKKLVAEGSHIDLVVGGHTHQKLMIPTLIENKRKELIGIVQTGEHGKYLGEVLVDIDLSKKAGKRVKILEYKLHPIEQAGEKDLSIEQFVKDVYAQIENHYGAEFLYQPLGVTDQPMQISYTSRTFWQDFYTDAIREGVKADIAFNNHAFMGPSQSAGEITREKIMSFFPHFFNVTHDLGWGIYTASVRGNMVKQIVKLSLNLGQPFLVSGMDYEIVVNEKGEKHAKHFKFQGKPMKNSDRFTLALPEGYYKGLQAVSSIAANLVMDDVVDTGISVWEAVEEKVKKEF